MDASGMNPATAQAFEGMMQQKQVSLRFGLGVFVRMESLGSWGGTRDGRGGSESFGTRVLDEGVVEEQKEAGMLRKCIFSEEEPR